MGERLRQDHARRNLVVSNAAELSDAGAKITTALGGAVDSQADYVGTRWPFSRPCSSTPAEQYGRAFSYCLPRGNDGTGYLALGAPSSSNNNTAGFVFAPMHQLVPGVATFLTRKKIQRNFIEISEISYLSVRSKIFYFTKILSLTNISQSKLLCLYM
jgi:hypothetical protein